MARVVEILAQDGADVRAKTFEHLAAQDSIVVVRAVPEIRELVEMLRGMTLRAGCPPGEVSRIFDDGVAPTLETLSEFYKAFRHLRDSRYLSALFSDFAASLGLPTPLLIDSGFCRMMVPEHHAATRTRPDLFDPVDMNTVDAHEPERMIQHGGWGRPHRDVVAPHNHFQLNFWFPLHNVDKTQTLILFPDVYRQEIAENRTDVDPADPDSWGYGKAVQIPLQQGDTLIFHSQQMHASPSQAPGRSRFTVEVRGAAACIDDNATTYRRLFWSVGNFRSGDSSPAAARAAQLAEPMAATPTVDHALDGTTPHAILHRLFRTAKASLQAGYLHRPAGVLDDAIRLSESDWRRITEALDKLPTAEDEWLLAARLLLRQEYRALAIEALTRVYGRTRSYFWAMETGRIAAEAEIYDVAETAFGVAGARAAGSDVAPGKYTKGLPSRQPMQTLQLQPPEARRAARAFAARARVERSQQQRTTVTFDHRIFLRPWPHASFEHYNVIWVGGVFVATPVGRAFQPERMIEIGDGIVIANTEPDAVVPLGERLGRPLAEWRKPVGPAMPFGDHIIWHYFYGWYIVPRAHSTVNPLETSLLDIPGAFLIDSAGAWPAAPPAHFLNQCMTEIIRLAQLVANQARQLQGAQQPPG